MRPLERVKAHAAHFVHLVWEALHDGFNEAIPPMLCSPFDAELFGHWWFEGPIWLEAVARILHDYPTGIHTITCASTSSATPAPDSSPCTKAPGAPKAPTRSG